MQTPLETPQGLIPANLGRPTLPENLSYQGIDPKAEYTVAGSNLSWLNGVNSTTAFERLYGNVDDLDLRVGWLTKDQMDSDSHCGANLDCILLGALARPAEVNPAPENLYMADGDKALSIEVAEYVRRALNYLKLSHRDINLTAFQLGRAALKIGHSKAEIVKEVRRGGVDDRKLIISRIKSKSRQNSCFVVDRQNNIVGVSAFTGMYDQYKDPYENTNLQLYGVMPYSLLAGGGWEILPRDKFVVMTNRPGDTDSPLGTSVYRRAYVYYRMKRDAWSFYMKSLDQTAMPFLHIDVPSGVPNMYLPKTDGSEDTAAGQQNPVAATLAWATYARQGGTLVTQAGQNHPTVAKYLQATNSGDPFASAIGVFNSQITQAILLQQLATGESRHMARAAGQVHQDVLDVVMRDARRMVSDSITRDIFGPLVRENFPVRYHHLIPSCSFGDVELQDFSAWSESFAKLATAGLLDPSQFPAIWAMLGLPQADMDQFYKSLEFDSAVREDLMAPVVDAQGVAGPSQMETYTKQSLGKKLTRSMALRQTGRSGGIQNQ
jgi:hypothetical protein